jgi:RNA polymerase sigma-70 factor (ECF subfamily)
MCRGSGEDGTFGDSLVNQVVLCQSLRLGSESTRTQGHLAAARTAWPDLALDPAEFSQWLFEHSNDGVLPPEEHSADMYLACACAARVQGAVEAFERHIHEDARRAVARVHDAPAFIDEVLQVVREKLFVALGEQPPKITSYSGRGPLRRWVAAVAARTAVTFRRSRRERAHAPLALEAVLGSAEPELEYVKKRYKSQFADAVRAALTSLEPRDRVLLYLHYSDRFSVDKIGNIYKVGRSTAARWIASARERLLDSTRAELMNRAGLTRSEFDSIAALVAKSVEVSILRLLAPDGAVREVPRQPPPQK